MKRPHSTERERVNSTGSDTKSDPDGYLASESSGSLDNDDRKTPSKKKSYCKERHLERPQPTDSDSNGSRDRPKIQLMTISEPDAHINQVDLKQSIKQCSENENRSSSDGDCVQPYQEQNEPVHVSTQIIVYVYNYDALSFLI